MWLRAAWRRSFWPARPTPRARSIGRAMPRTHVDADAVLGPVEHRAEGDDAGVFHLPEGELRFGLGPVTCDDLGYWPVVVAGDEHVLAEDLLFQPGAGGGVLPPGQAQVFRLVTGQLPGDDAAGPGLGGGRLGLGPGFQ